MFSLLNQKTRRIVMKRRMLCLLLALLLLCSCDDRPQEAPAAAPAPAPPAELVDSPDFNGHNAYTHCTIAIHGYHYTIMFDHL